VGLGKLGLCMAAVFAHRGFEVAGVDDDISKVRSINERVSPIYEPRLQQFIKSSGNRLSATTEYESAVANSDTTFVVVPTPSNRSGGFSLKCVKPAMQRVGEILSRKDQYHLLVLTSTVMPGTMDQAVRPTVEKSSGKICGKDFGLCYNPEFVALGDVINGLLEPDLVLIGESDSCAGEVLSGIYNHVCLYSPPIERMNFINAEIAKIAVNSFVTTKMSFANTLAEICEKLPGADVDRITTAIGRDKRIGPAYLKGALGYGGPCFPRDNMAFAYFAERLGAQADLARVTHKVNLRQVKRIIALLEGEGLRPPMKMGILGLTYKPNTNVVEASQSLMLAQALSGQGFEVHVYDPVATDNVRCVLGSALKYEATTEDCIAKSDLCIVATPWKDFSKIDKTLFEGKIVLDCWRILGKDEIQKATKYIALGIGRGSVKSRKA